MAKKKEKLTFGQTLQRSIERRNKKVAENKRIFLEECRKQGKKPSEGISLTGMFGRYPAKK